MKKARLILVCISLLAITGGALAFKANRDLADIYCTNAIGVCFTALYQKAEIVNVFSTTRPCPNHNLYYTLPNCPQLVAGRVYTQPNL